MPSNSKTNQKDEEFALISREKLLSLYAGLLRCQMLESFISQHVPVPNARTRTSAAAAVAIRLDQLTGDVFAASPRDLLPAFVEGKRLPVIFSALKTPVATARSKFAVQIRAALAAARKHRRRQSRRIAIIFGRPATSPQWQTLLQIATDERLPIIFVSNGESHHRLRTHPPRNLPAMTVDRDDVVALYRVASESIAHARRGNGPTLIECIQWTSKETAPSSSIQKLEAYLAQKQISPARRKAAVTEKFGSELARRRRSFGKPVAARRVPTS